MDDVTVKTADALDYYQGPNAIPGIRFRTAAKQLGVTAWGMSVIDIEAGCDKYPEHDHTDNGQEEVYVVLRGSATARTSAGEHRLEAGSMIRCPPSVKRKFIPGPQGVSLLAIGATPGQAYQPRR